MLNVFIILQIIGIACWRGIQGFFSALNPANVDFSQFTHLIAGGVRRGAPDRDVFRAMPDFLRPRSVSPVHSVSHLFH